MAASAMMPIDDLRPDEGFAREQDASDPLTRLRERFHIPGGVDGAPAVYLSGNSLGLMPKGVEEAIEQEIDDWRRHAVHAHFKARTPWFSYHEVFRDAGARLVGAAPGEVVMMNSLTTNLHLMMVSFFRPTAERHKILIEENAFPSDLYAVQSQCRHHGLDPARAIITAPSREGEATVPIEGIESILEERGDEIALVLIGGVNYFSGQAFDIERITACAHERGALAGFDLAHAAGNLQLALHDWGADFAVWCSYKYLNAGPGAVGGCFVHERHGRDLALPRFAGWWGNDPKTRFQMHRVREFEALTGADGWQLSNPSILAMAPLRVSLGIFDDVGMAALRGRSERLTAYLEWLIDRIPGDRYRIITPRVPSERGAQLSIRVKGEPRALLAALEARGVVCDFREPDVIRAAPAPLYNTFHDLWRFARVLAEDGAGATAGAKG
ncbi:MAG: kynureninase [Planctomycetota bacterium]